MRFRGLIALCALLAVCSPDFTGAPCSSSAECPTAQHCVAGRCAVGVDGFDGGNGDSGVVDAGHDAGALDGGDGGSGAGDGGSDGGFDGGDGGYDGGVDGGDGGFDAGVDAGFDGGGFDGGDAGFDAGLDGGTIDAGDASVDAGRFAFLPVAPSARQFMWQGQQVQFIDDAGRPCQVTIALAVGDRAACFTAANGELLCAGVIDTLVLDAGFFTNIGESQADQIFLSPTTVDSNGLCIHKTDGSIRCLGNHNDAGQFGIGDAGSVTGFVPWGGGVVGLGPTLVMATGDWGQLCALDLHGDVWCSGAGYGLSPVLLTDGGVDAGRFVVEVGGGVEVNPVGVWRAGEGLTTCVISANGLECAADGGVLGPDGGIVGNPGQVVMGGAMAELFGFPPCANFAPACWLEANSSVTCMVCLNGTPALYAPPAASGVLMLATNPAGTVLCGVLDDGRVTCLGADPTQSLVSPAAPAGSVRTTCN